MKVLSKDRRKYSIIEVLREMPVEVESHTIKALPAELGVSASTFRKWINLEKASKTDIPGVKLVYIAKRLGTTVEDLCNDVPKVRTFVKELKDPTNIAAKFGLSR